MVKKAAKNSEIFDLEFNEISLAPDKNNPKKVWLTGKSSEELRILQEDVEKNLGIFISSKKSFSPHITLGRIRAHKWDALETKPEIFEKFPLVIEANSIDVVASDFASHGPEYTVIESCPLS
jgi:2'-5' RNA ligase